MMTPSRPVRTILLSLREPLYRHRGGIGKKTKRYAPLSKGEGVEEGVEQSPRRQCSAKPRDGPNPMLPIVPAFQLMFGRTQRDACLRRDTRIGHWPSRVRS